MNLELTHEQVVALASALDTYLEELRRMLASPDGDELKQAIRRDVILLESVKAKLAHGAAQEDLYEALL